MKFLTGRKVPAEFKKARKTASKTRLAAAFWGNGAVAKLGLGSGARGEILCNARHQGCNPEVILDLVRKKHKVKTHDHLHAKMYLTDKVAIIGSSNVSTNGLNDEEPNSGAWEEANVLVEDPNVLRDAHAEFKRLWDAADDIKVLELKELIALRKARPQQPRPLTTPFLIKACRERPDLFKNIGILTWDGNLSRDGLRALKEFKETAKPLSRSDISADDIRNAQSFEYDVDVPAGWYFSFNLKTPGHPKYVGLVQIAEFKIERAKDDLQYFGYKRRKLTLETGQTMRCKPRIETSS